MIFWKTTKEFFTFYFILFRPMIYIITIAYIELNSIYRKINIIKQLAKNYFYNHKSVEKFAVFKWSKWLEKRIDKRVSKTDYYTKVAH